MREVCREMSKLKERDLLKQEIGLYQKLFNNLLERQKAANEGKPVPAIPQKVLIPERHNKLVGNQLHERNASILD